MSTKAFPPLLCQLMDRFADQGFGLQTERHPTAELWPRIHELVRTRNMVQVHPIDDTKLIAGYGRSVSHSRSIILV